MSARQKDSGLTAIFFCTEVDYIYFADFSLVWPQNCKSSPSPILLNLAEMHDKIYGAIPFNQESFRHAEWQEEYKTAEESPTCIRLPTVKAAYSISRSPRLEDTDVIEDGRDEDDEVAYGISTASSTNILNVSPLH
ncbi:hypothetical protein DBV15_01893 [Temnothorax longispinosus]|uniref:Uncharacterized protein n=1 Tax=Temnothorax longispinosus TaxID=300112 RepID=A0A4S2KXS7_9HYME|nr:hypothetical protein DBV15_01893 [Temnothorax longispinosus]